VSIAIHILSGSRCGEEVCLDAEEFRVGDTPQCEIYFDPRRDVSSEGQSALFRLQEDGWYVRPGGGRDLLLNHSLMERETRIRSGDVVRLSESGPDFLFTLTSRAIPAASRPPDTDHGAPVWRLAVGGVLAALIVAAVMVWFFHARDRRGGTVAGESESATNMESVSPENRSHLPETPTP
jgi:hypothetical protein